MDDNTILEMRNIKKNFDEIYNSCYASTLPPEIVVCEYRNDANLIGALYQHLN